MPNIIYTIPDAVYEEAKDDFLTAHPVPKDENGDPLMSDGDWIKEWGRRQFVKARRNGRIIKAHNSVSVSDNWIS